MYTDCIHKQNELEKAEEMEDDILNEEKSPDPEKLDNNVPKRKRKRKQIKVHIPFDRTCIMNHDSGS